MAKTMCYPLNLPKKQIFYRFLMRLSRIESIYDLVNTIPYNATFF